MILRDLGSLATARRTGNTLEFTKAVEAATKAGAPKPAKPKTTVDEETPASPAKKPDVATGLEALRAVLPATFITLYSTAVLLLQNATQAHGAAARAAEQAALAEKYIKDPNGLKLALQQLPVETPDFVGIRILVAVAAAAFLCFYAFKKAQVPKKDFVVLEPLLTTVAFIAWALGAPGTFLAVYMPATQLLVTTVAIVFVTAIGLWALSTTVLKKPASA